MTEIKKLEAFKGRKYLRIMIPKEITNKLKWKAGQYVKLTVLNKNIIIERITK